VHLSLPGGQITASIALPGAAGSDLSANAAGTILVAGEADSGGRGAVQRRDPTTGALVASHPMMGVSPPAVTGPAGSAVWVSEATGMMGYVQRLDAATMTAEGSACREGGTTSTCVQGTSDVTARLASGLLWITQIAGGKVYLLSHTCLFRSLAWRWHTGLARSSRVGCRNTGRLGRASRPLLPPKAAGRVVRLS
jgi:hypothetical protein